MTAKEIKEKYTAAIWDKQSPVGNFTREQLVKAKPSYINDDVIITYWDGDVRQVFSISEVKERYPAQTESMTTEEIAKFFIENRTAQMIQQTRAVEFREIGMLEVLAEQDERIFNLEERIKKLENK